MTVCEVDEVKVALQPFRRSRVLGSGAATSTHVVTGPLANLVDMGGIWAVQLVQLLPIFFSLSESSARYVPRYDDRHQFTQQVNHIIKAKVA